MVETAVEQDEPDRGFTGYVVILLDEQIPVGFASNLLDHAVANNDLLDELLAFLNRDNNPPWSSRAVTGVDPGRLVELEALAGRRDAPLPVSLSRYWRIDSRFFGGSPQEVARELLSVRGVAWAYAETAATDPAVITPDDESRFPDQRYLRPAPRGVGAQWAWERQGGGGELVRFVDVEQGWDLNHTDVAGWATTPLTGQNRVSSWDHGTAVLDIIVGLDNGSGAIGLAPACESVAVCSHFDGSVNANGRVVMKVANAVTVAVSALVGEGTDAAGAVLLLEVERPADGMMPAEVDDADFAAIRLATGLGIVVVEAAGNGNRDIGAWVSDLGRRLTRDGAEDSGAIVVASCNRQLETDTSGGVTITGHSRNVNRSSNFGSRVDCYAWGDGVAAANGSGGFQDDFSGTSSAAAIIAGVAVVVQGMHRAATGSFLAPATMRDLLAGPGGTPQVPVAARHVTPIGVMPDLQAIGESIGAVLRSPG